MINLLLLFWPLFILLQFSFCLNDTILLSFQKRPNKIDSSFFISRLNHQDGDRSYDLLAGLAVEGFPICRRKILCGQSRQRNTRRGHVLIHAPESAVYSEFLQHRWRQTATFS